MILFDQSIITELCLFTNVRGLLLFAYENEQSIFSSPSSINAIPDRVVGPTRPVTVVTQQLSKGAAPLGTDGIGCAGAGSPSGRAGISVGYTNRVRYTWRKVWRDDLSE